MFYAHIWLEKAQKGTFFFFLFFLTLGYLFTTQHFTQAQQTNTRGQVLLFCYFHLFQLFPSSSLSQTHHSWSSHPAIKQNRITQNEYKIKKKKRFLLLYCDCYLLLTLSVSTSSRTSSMVASSPIPYSVMACFNSSLVIYL